ncbi:MAG: restriction endonuclease subunit S [Sideroxydans sp.]|nr:restriction endonuclease subunit S [Sideroxydans sp.]
MKAGWQTKNLGDVCDVIGGGTPSKDKPAFYSGDISWATVRDLKQEVITSTEFKITKEAVKSSATNIIPCGNVVIATRVGLGKVCLLGQDTAINQDLRGIVPHDTTKLDVRFLFWWLKSIADVIVAEGTGATVQGVKLPFVKSLQVPLPPLPEQQRIVGILDEAFYGIATAKAHAEQNLQNAHALFESHLQSVFTQRGEGWMEKSVKEIAAPTKGSIRTGPFGSQLLHSEFVDEGIAVLGIDNAVANEFRWGKSRFITPEKYRQLERYTVHPGDVLITIMGTCGRCAIVPNDIPTSINTKHICCITLDRKQCLPSYLHIYFLHAPQSQAFLAKHAKGAIMAGLNMGLIQELPVVLPPIEVQAAIVKATDTLREETQRLESLYQRKLAALDELKKSLLHQAFSGAL